MLFSGQLRGIDSDKTNGERVSIVGNNDSVSINDPGTFVLADK
jgi:hypothetical protein